jgi:hypothetical protein
MARAAEAVAATLRAEHKIETGADDDFRVQTQDDLIATRTQATQTMTSLLAGIAAVSLLVGGIGIMNIMLVSVTERTARDRPAPRHWRERIGRAHAVPRRGRRHQPRRRIPGHRAWIRRVRVRAGLPELADDGPE